jgi:hypothetical protein
MTTTDRVQLAGETLVALMQSNLDSKGLNASGKLRESLTADTTETGAVVTLRIFADSAGYWWFVNNMKRKGSGNPYSSVRFIYDWSKQKGLAFADDKARLSFAFAVSYKHNMQDGYGQWQRERRKDFATAAIASNEWTITKTQLVQEIAADRLRKGIKFGMKTTETAS